MVRCEGLGVRAKSNDDAMSRLSGLNLFESKVQQADGVAEVVARCQGESLMGLIYSVVVPERAAHEVSEKSRSLFQMKSKDLL